MTLVPVENSRSKYKNNDNFIITGKYVKYLFLIISNEYLYTDLWIYKNIDVDNSFILLSLYTYLINYIQHK